MSKVKFISTVFLKQNTTIENNVDDDKLTPFIYKVQDIYLHQILGSTFMTHLKDAIVNNTLTTDETFLIKNYIQNMIAEWTVYEVMPFLSNKLTNKAVSQESSEFSSPSSLDEIKFLRNSVRDMAEFYSQRLSKYLCDNITLFPTYQNPDSKENVSRNSRTYFNGIYIPKTNPINIRTNKEDYDCNC